MKRTFTLNEALDYIDTLHPEEPHLYDTLLTGNCEDTFNNYLKATELLSDFYSVESSVGISGRLLYLQELESMNMWLQKDFASLNLHYNRELPEGIETLVTQKLEELSIEIQEIYNDIESLRNKVMIELDI